MLLLFLFAQQRQDMLARLADTASGMRTCISPFDRNRSIRGYEQEKAPLKRGEFFLGLPDRIRVSPAGSVSYADLTVHRTVIQHRSGFESYRIEKASPRDLPRYLLFGLPDRIRTCGLESRSLTRYPAVPRVDISKRMNDIVHTLARNIISFFGFFVNVKKR